MWLHCVLLAAVCTLPVTSGFLMRESEDLQVVCVGKDFRLPVYSVSRVVTFTPSSPPGPRRVLLEKNDVRDPRFEWTRDRMLVLREVSHSDQGLYSIKLSSGFTYETVRLSVSECIRSFRRSYGEIFQHFLPHDASILEFCSRGSPPDSQPVVLWNRSDPDVGGVWGQRGRVQEQEGGVVWVASRVTQKDQGNYTVRDDQGRALSRSDLTVHGHTSNVTRFTTESLSLPLLLPLPQSHLIFTPSPPPQEGAVGPFDLRPPQGPVLLLSEGRVVERVDLRYRGLISVIGGRNGTSGLVTVVRLTMSHDGMYDVRDQDGNLVSSTTLMVIDKAVKWRAVLKSISVPSGMFVSLAGFILFMKRYPQCSLADIISSLTNPHPAAAPSDQDYSQSRPGTPRKWTPRASPSHMRYTPVTVDGGCLLTPLTVRPWNHETHTPANRSPAHQSETQRATNGGPAHQTTSSTENTADEEREERPISFSLPGATDCLQTSSECVQFHFSEDSWRKTPETRQHIPILPIETQQQLSTLPLETHQHVSTLPLEPQQHMSTLPLDTDTSASCSVFTSHKLS